MSYEYWVSKFWKKEIHYRTDESCLVVEYFDNPNSIWKPFPYTSLGKPKPTDLIEQLNVSLVYDNYDEGEYEKYLMLTELQK